MQDYLWEVLNENMENEEIFYSITDDAIDRENDNGYDDLDDLEKKSFVVGKLLMEVNNGGFDQYFVNTKGVYARETVDFLDLIGEKKFPKILEEAISVFKAIIPEDRKMDEYSKIEHKFYEMNSDDYDILYEKFIVYLKSSISKIK